MTEHTVHLLQSVSKSVTATVLAILVAQGRLRVDAPVTYYLPELDATAYRGAIRQQVLDMTSGVFSIPKMNNPGIRGPEFAEVFK